MTQINLLGRVVDYEIVFKDNKNTYFYFKKEGCIKINASKYQSEKQIVKYMQENGAQFLYKLDKAKYKKKTIDESVYHLWGTEFTRTKTDAKTLQFDTAGLRVLEPNVDTDQLQKQYKKFEKNLVIEALKGLQEKYKNNGLIDISNLTFSTRYTKTRFGSCNAVRRRININTLLIHYDPVYFEYVFLHEICHLTFQDHSRNFYNLLLKISPNFKMLRKELRDLFDYDIK